MALTKVAIDNAAIREKDYKLFDANGLFLLVKKNGSRLWRFKYSHGGTEKSLAIGPYPDVSLKCAREKRDDAKKLLRDGVDPSAKKQEAKREARRAAEHTFAAVVDEWIKVNIANWSDSYADEVTRRLKKNLFQHLGSRSIADIDATDLLDEIRRIEGRGATDMSHRVLSHCGSIWRFATRSRYCAQDITHDLSGALIKHKKCNHPAVRTEELPRLIHDIDGYRGEYQTRIALQLLCITFVRTSEMIKMPWTEINFAEKMWIIPESRMKMGRDHMVPLSTHAIELLQELHTINGRSKLVFVGRTPLKSISNNTLIYALYRLGYKGMMTGHGFRAVASTILNEARRPSGVRMFDPDAIEMQLAHVEESGSRRPYNRAEYLQDRIEMMQWWADYIGRIRIQGGRT